MIPKKRILERNMAEQPTSKAAKVTLPPSALAAKNNQRPLKKRIRKVASKQEDEEEAMDDEMADGGGGGGGGGNSSNGLTLEQFTEIVLASEGMAPAAAAAAEAAGAAAAASTVHAATSSCGQELRQQRLPIVAQRHVGGGKEEENNNKRPRQSSEEDVLANLIQNNNDLIVEVKPMRPKPVVLSPRQPPGAHLLPYAHNPNPSLSSSVVVSVKPRLLSGSPSTAAAAAQQQQPRLPPSKPQSIHRMMEEWFSKMQPPIAEQAANAEETAPESAPPSTSSALNLSTKSPKDGVTSPKGMSRTTQVYLRPITTPPKLSSPVSTSSGNSSLATQKYNLEKRCATDASPTVKKLSPPRLDVIKMEQKNLHRQRHPPRQQEPGIGVEEGGGGGRAQFSRQVGRATPFEGQIQLQDARSRALRDVEMALTRDIHGNL